MRTNSRCFSARIAALSEVLFHIASVCKLAGMKSLEVLRVELVIEELFTNTIRHGYGQESDQPIWIATHVSDASLCITYQDAAPAYNPLDHPSNRPAPSLGGLGVTLVVNIAHPQYHYQDGRNTLILTFHVNAVKGEGEAVKRET